ncbi:hypothetical protein [Photobacterium andalusiense]|uniref:Uncharacterized protein n=1 Tax=Photobacterium andalusiense TaxID=2204296 RepID=A0A1Y6MBU8_9GAMM|nr:hypothetical protein [Photobacterium andalusiense]SMY34016.1 hypothetical protein PAND9192_01121 [Photobacterium andalusiense]
MVELIHITSVKIAFDILESTRYKSMYEYGGYDGGMNFLGVLGENANTQPRARGVRLHFIWGGEVSEPVSYDAYGCNNANVLYDFNGSGNHFRNNDPRYFLPYRSEGLTVEKLEIDSDQALLEGWCEYKGGIIKKLFSIKLFHSYLMSKAKEHVLQLNKKIERRDIKISIRREKVKSE